MNMQKLMAEAQRMQRNIQQKQKEINDTIYEAKSSAFEIKMNGKKEIVDLKIDKTLIEGPDDIEALEDMIKIAYNDVLGQIEKDTKDKLGSYADSLNGLI